MADDDKQAPGEPDDAPEADLDEILSAAGDVTDADADIDTLADTPPRAAPPGDAAPAAVIEAGVDVPGDGAADEEVSPDDLPAGESPAGAVDETTPEPGESAPKSDETVAAADAELSSPSDADAPLESVMRDQIDKELDAAFSGDPMATRTPVGGNAAAEAEMASDAEAQEILMEEVSSLASQETETPGGEVTDRDDAASSATDKSAERKAPPPNADAAIARIDAEVEKAEEGSREPEAPSDGGRRRTDEVAAEAAEAASGEAISLAEREGLLERPAVAGAEADKGGEAEDADAVGAPGIGRAGRWLLGLGASVLELADRPFGWLGPQERNLVGILAIGTIVMSVVLTALKLLGVF